ncbi:hypothetical protein [Hydrogenophaga sp.]|nr:hypothetical protein [Hydrogenophaga sp.]
MASSSSFGGMIFAVLRLTNRSMTSANPMTEQRINGQMGHPAACMMESKSGLQSGAAGSRGASLCRDYGSGVMPTPQNRRPIPLAMEPSTRLVPCTDSVDNFVKNPAGMCREPAQRFTSNKSISKQAVQNASESMSYPFRPGHTSPQHRHASIHAVCGHFCPGSARG